jgi:hypothetical protein
LCADGSLLYGSSDWERRQRDIVAFDPQTEAITQTLFSRQSTDVEDIVSTRWGVPISISGPFDRTLSFTASDAAYSPG